MKEKKVYWTIDLIFFDFKVTKITEPICEDCTLEIVLKSTVFSESE